MHIITVDVTAVVCRVARHRREVIEPEVIQEVSEDEDRFKGKDEEESSEEEELDEEVRSILLNLIFNWQTHVSTLGGVSHHQKSEFVFLKKLFQFPVNKIY